MGRVVLGGDLNSRCAVNGDTRVKACGRQLLEFCDDTALSMVNSLEEVCAGEFSRTQVVCRRGLEYTNRTTIDYVLVDICNVTRWNFWKLMTLILIINLYCLSFVLVVMTASAS